MSSCSMLDICILTLASSQLYAHSARQLNICLRILVCRRKHRKAAEPCLDPGKTRGRGHHLCKRYHVCHSVAHQVTPLGYACGMNWKQMLDGSLMLQFLGKPVCTTTAANASLSVCVWLQACIAFPQYPRWSTRHVACIVVFLCTAQQSMGNAHVCCVVA